jgi:hypothetical protein
MICKRVHGQMKSFNHFEPDNISTIWGMRSEANLPVQLVLLGDLGQALQNLFANPLICHRFL